MSIVVSLIVAIIGVIGSAIFSGLETGLYVVNRVRLAVRAGHGDRSAARLESELEHPERLLATLLIANNAANYAGSLGVAAILNSFELSATGVILLNTALVVPILLVFGETLPKDLFRTRADNWIPRFVGPLRVARRVLTIIGLVPLLSLVDRLVQRVVGGDPGDRLGPRARMAWFIRESAASGSLSPAQLDLADRALSMRHLAVTSEMTPWRQVVTVREGDLDGDPRAIAQRTMRSRLPVIDSSGRVLGVIGVQDLLLGRNSKACIDDSIPRLGPGTQVFVALETLRQARRPMGVVEDGAGRPIGIVTLKDLVEPLLGDLRAW
ncbi:MAG: hypothetical protein CMJ67_02355 [Planctomycetaceae bacterium]|nr:hypothetical protein [Planctomycetaceae bacterium]